MSRQTTDEVPCCPNCGQNDELAQIDCLAIMTVFALDDRKNPVVVASERLWDTQEPAYKKEFNLPPYRCRSCEHEFDELEQGCPRCGRDDELIEYDYVLGWAQIADFDDEGEIIWTGYTNVGDLPVDEDKRPFHRFTCGSCHTQFDEFERVSPATGSCRA